MKYCHSRRVKRKGQCGRSREGWEGFWDSQLGLHSWVLAQEKSLVQRLHHGQSNCGCRLWVSNCSSPMQSVLESSIVAPSLGKVAAHVWARPSYGSLCSVPWIYPHSLPPLPQDQPVCPGQTFFPGVLTSSPPAFGEETGLLWSQVHGIFMLWAAPIATRVSNDWKSHRHSLWKCGDLE